MISPFAPITSATSSIQTIRPVAATSIHGIAFYRDRLLAVDNRNGYLFSIDPISQNTQILNAQHTQEFIGSTGLAVVDGLLWFTADNGIYHMSLIHI